MIERVKVSRSEQTSSYRTRSILKNPIIEEYDLTSSSNSYNNNNNNNNNYNYNNNNKNSKERTNYELEITSINSPISINRSRPSSDPKPLLNNNKNFNNSNRNNNNGNNNNNINESSNQNNINIKYERSNRNIDNNSNSNEGRSNKKESIRNNINDNDDENTRPVLNNFDLLVEPWRRTNSEVETPTVTSNNKSSPTNKSSPVQFQPEDKIVDDQMNQVVSLSCLGTIFSCLGSLPGCFCFPTGKTNIPEGNSGLVIRSGKYHKTLNSGKIRIDPLSDKLELVEIKTQTISIKSSNTVTRDLSKVEVNCTIYWKVVDPYKAKFSVKDLNSTLRLYSEGSIQSSIGKMNLKDLINDRDRVSHQVLKLINMKSETWGIEVSSVQISEIVITKDLQNSLDQILKDKLSSSIKLSTDLNQSDSSNSFINKTNDKNNCSTTAMEIRKFEALKSISKEPNTKILIIPSNSDLNCRNQRQNFKRSTKRTEDETDHGSDIIKPNISPSTSTSKKSIKTIRPKNDFNEKCNELNKVRSWNDLSEEDLSNDDQSF